MTRYVIDTNVAIAANGGESTHADPICQLECVNLLEEVCNSKVVIVDDQDLIFGEYIGRLSLAGVPGIGDKFVKHVFDHMHGGVRVLRVAITPCSDARRGFGELIVNDLDKSDRKFLAAAVVAGADILNATDSDWGEHEALTNRLGVKVRQLCPQHASKSGNLR